MNKRLWHPFIIAADFDGTITDGSSEKYPACGNPHVGIAKFFHILRSYGIYIILWTCRNNEYLETAIEYLHSNDIEVDAVNDNYSSELNNYLSRKIYADIYWDNSSVTGRASYMEIVNRIIELNPFRNEEVSQEFSRDMNNFLLEINYEEPTYNEKR
jgi:hydroxymethylpyrimidine pyrophosphatase-like HAD family hydrolase